MIEEDPQQLRRRADAYDQMARSIMDVQALQALQSMARDYRLRADALTASDDHGRRELRSSVAENW